MDNEFVVKRFSDDEDEGYDEEEEYPEPDEEDKIGWPYDEEEDVIQ